MEQKSKAIGNTTYLVTQMDAISALKIQTKLMKILGAGIFSLIGKSPSAEKIQELIPALMENFDDEVVNDFVLALFERNVFKEENGTPKVVNFATHFTGKIMEMWQVAAFILEVNFSMGEQSESSSRTTDQAGETQEN